MPSHTPGDTRYCSLLFLSYQFYVFITCSSTVFCSTTAFDLKKNIGCSVKLLCPLDRLLSHQTILWPLPYTHSQFNFLFLRLNILNGLLSSIIGLWIWWYCSIFNGLVSFLNRWTPWNQFASSNKTSASFIKFSKAGK